VWNQTANKAKILLLHCPSNHSSFKGKTVAKLLFKLNGVTDEEADFVRARLDEAEVDYYETSKGRFGISLGGIWLRAEGDFDATRVLLNEIQQDWLDEVRQYPVPSMGERFYEHPTRFILTLIAIVAIASLTVIPFLVAFK